MERIKLNLIPSGVAPVVHLSQYDEGRKFGIDLFEGDSVYVLDGTETLTVNSRKPDGHVVVISVTNTGTSSLEVETVEQLTAVHGTSYAKLKIEKGSVTIATLEFLIAVSRDPLENGDPSESFVANLNTQIANAVADQYDSNNVIFDNDPTTGHGIGYTVTSEGIKTAIDNAIGGLSIPDELNDLSDVNITSPTQGEALVFDADGNIVNGTVSTVGNLDDLSDVDTTGKQEGDSLRYNGVEWVAKPTTVKMTQAEYDAIVDFTPYENTHIVITDAPNLNPTASDIEYSSGVSVADKLDDLTSGLANVGDKLIFRQTQLNLPSAVNVTAGGVFTLLGGVNLNSLTWSALDGIDDLSSKTLVGAHLIWTNGSSCVPVNELVESGNKFSLGVYAVSSATVSAVRLLTWWK